MARRTNVTEIYFHGEEMVTASMLWQEDHGQIFKFPDLDLPTAYEVDFANAGDATTITQIGDANGVTVPSQFFETGKPIHAFIYLHSGNNDGYTVNKATIQVHGRPARTNDVPTPEEQTAIEEAIEALNAAVEQTGADVESADASATLSRSYAVGDTESRTGEETDNSKYYSEQAYSAQVDAETAQTKAETAQGKAEDAQIAAETAQEKAETAQGKAEDARDAAETAQGFAQGYANNASQSATDAGGYADAASASANDASDSAQSAYGYASDASGYASDAHGYANAASGSASDASGYASDALSYKNATVAAAQSILDLTADASVDANVGTPAVAVTVTETNSHKNMSFTFQNLKGVPGNDGADGEDGVGIASITENPDYSLTITLTDGTEFTTSSLKGDTGATGKGIKSITLNANSQLVITFTDNTTTTTASVKGDPGVTPSFTIGTVTGLPAGSDPTATITGTSANPVLNFGLVQGSPGEVTEAELVDTLQDKADIIVSSASGEIVTIADGANNLPVVDLSVSILPVQDLHGQDAPYPPGGGKNKLSPLALQTYKSLNSGWTWVDNVASANGVTVEVLLRDGSPSGEYRITGTATANTNFYLLRAEASNYAGMILNGIPSGTVSKWEMYYALQASPYTAWGYDVGNGVTLSESASGMSILTWRIKNGGTFNDVFKPMIRPASISDSTFAPYSNLCPISGWTGVDVYHSDADTSNPTTYPISWQSSAGTVYGCNIGLVSGVLTVDHSIQVIDGARVKNNTAKEGAYWRVYMNQAVAEDDKMELAYLPILANKYLGVSGNSSAVAGRNNSVAVNYRDFSQILMRDDAITTLAELTASLNDVPLVIYYPLLHHKIYQLSETQIKTLLGTNNFWSNGNGSLDLEYRADTKLYIQQLTKPTEDDMVANQNITSGSFFMVGNRLFLSSVAIGQGETIIPGTNCSEISLADALNQINS